MTSHWVLPPRNGALRSTTVAIDYGAATWAELMRTVEAAQPLSPLSAAAKAGNVVAVRRLLHEGAIPDGAPGDHGKPLWQADPPEQDAGA